VKKLISTFTIQWE